jgi:excisionase family DNA binding protein
VENYTLVVFLRPDLLTFVHGCITVVHMDHTPERDAYTVGEAAERLGLSRSGLYKLIGKGEIVTVKLGGSRRITPEAIRDFLASKVAS